MKSVLNTISNFTIGSLIKIDFTVYDESYSHSLIVKVSGTVVKTIPSITSGTSINFSSGEINKIYSLLGSSNKAVFTFELSTSDGSKSIGVSTKTATGTIPSDVIPLITDVYFSDAISEIDSKFGFYIKNKSKVVVNIDASPSNGARLISYKTTIENKDYLTNEFTTDVLQIAGEHKIPVVVKDSRGLTATSDRYLTVEDYHSPYTESFKVDRCNSSGVLDAEGSYALVSFVSHISSLSSKNDKSISLMYKSNEDSEWTTYRKWTSDYDLTVSNLVVSGINSDLTYDFKVVTTDYFETTEQMKPLESGYTILDIKADGKGIAFGGVSVKNGYQYFGDMYDESDARILNGLAFYEAGGSTDVNTTIEELVLSNTNTPDTGLWYVRTMFYATKSATANRVQVAYPYSANKPTYFRYYVNGNWSSWEVGDIKEKYISDSNGYIWFGNGLLIQWGTVSITPTSANVVTQTTIYFNKTYDLLPVVLAVPKTNVPYVISSGVGQGSTISAGLYSMVIYLNRTNTVATNFLWTAIGYKS